MKKLLILIFILTGFYTQAQPGFFYPNVIIDEDGTFQDNYDLTVSGDTLTISSSGITSPAIKLSDYAGTGGKLAAFDENGTLIRTAVDSALSAVGDVDGPASSTDNAITRFDGTTGKIIQNSSVVIDDESSNATSINMGTVDGSDNKFLSISGGGAAQTGRGSYITLSGLEHGQAGVAAFASGTGAAMNISSGANINMSPTAGSRVNITGNLSLGTVTMSTPTNTIGIANGTAPSSSPINAVQLYAEDVSASSELKVRDEAGNITVLSDIGTNFVPYTGAITNVNLGSNSLTTTGTINGAFNGTLGATTPSTVAATTGAFSDNVTVTKSISSSYSPTSVTSHLTVLSTPSTVADGEAGIAFLAAGSGGNGGNGKFGVQRTGDGSGDFFWVTRNSSTYAERMRLTAAGNLNVVTGALQLASTTRISNGGVSTFTQTNTDNTRLDGNTLSSTDTNGNLNIDPNGTGDVFFKTDNFRVYDNGVSVGESDVLNVGTYYGRGASNGFFLMLEATQGSNDMYVTDDAETFSEGGYDVTYRTSGGTESVIYERTKTINIGDWDMDATATVNVAHGLGTSWINIRTVQVKIFDDGVSAQTDLTSGFAGSAAPAGYVQTGSTNIVLTRYNSGPFDATDYNATSFNRGYVTITYTTTCTGGAICP